MRNLRQKTGSSKRRGSVFVEYLLLVTIIGIGVIVGLVAVRKALVEELLDLAAAIIAITPPPVP